MGLRESLLTGAVHLLAIFFLRSNLAQKLFDSRNALYAQSYASGRTYRKTPHI